MTTEFTSYRPSELEAQRGNNGVVLLTPFYIQAALKEVLHLFMLHNSPASLGFAFNEKYNPERTAGNNIYLDMAFSFDTASMQTRPAIFVYREDAAFQGVTFDRTLGSNSAESERLRSHLTRCNFGVACIAQEIGFVEALANYITIPLLEFESQIRADLCLQRFRMSSMSRPQLYQESKEHYIIVLGIEVAYFTGTKIREEALKIKNICVDYLF